MVPKVAYQTGTDIMALKFTIEQFIKWSSKRGNKHLVSKHIKKRIQLIKDNLDSYEKLYGDRSYLDGMRVFEKEENIKLNDLDNETKEGVEKSIEEMKKHN
jgi:hypothetical protein